MTHEDAFALPGESPSPEARRRWQFRLAEYDTYIHDEAAELRQQHEAERRAEGKRLWAAFMLARDVDACEALLLGDDVPEHRLDPEWVRRLGR